MKTVPSGRTTLFAKARWYAMFVILTVVGIAGGAFVGKVMTKALEVASGGGVSGCFELGMGRVGEYVPTFW